MLNNSLMYIIAHIHYDSSCSILEFLESFWLSVCIKLVKRIKCQITLMIVIVYFLRYHRFKIFEIADSAFFVV